MSNKPYSDPSRFHSASRFHSVPVPFPGPVPVPFPSRFHSHSRTNQLDSWATLWLISSHRQTWLAFPSIEESF